MGVFRDTTGSATSEVKRITVREQTHSNTERPPQDGPLPYHAWTESKGSGPWIRIGRFQFMT